MSVLKVLKIHLMPILKVLYGQYSKVIVQLYGNLKNAEVIEQSTAILKVL